MEEGVMISFDLNFYKKHSLETVYLNSSQQGCGELQEVLQREPRICTWQFRVLTKWQQQEYLIYVTFLNQIVSLNTNLCQVFTYLKKGLIKEKYFK